MGLLSGYSDDAITTDNDRFLTYAADGSTKLTPASNLNKYIGDGWILSGDSWSYSSYNSTTGIGVINANSGANTKYTVGNWLRFTQPTLGTKYARVTAVATSTITAKFYGGTVLSNEAITSPVYSTAFKPLGAPAAAIEANDINFTSTGSGIWIEELGRTTLTSAGDTISVTPSSTKKYLKLQASYQAASAAIDPIFRFNSDTGSNYSSSMSFYDGNGTTNATSATGIPADVNPNTNDQAFLKADIINLSSKTKFIVIDSVFSAVGAGNTQVPAKIFGQWANTSGQITSIQLVNVGAGDFAIGSELVVLGHD